MSFRVVIDSCGELTDEMKKSGNFVSAPLTLQVDEYIVQDDEEHFNQAEFLKKVAECPNCPKSSCPSPEIYRDAYDCDADHVYVFNSCSASVGETLIGLKIQELEERGLSFEEVVEQTEAYILSQDTWFVLENLDTLRKNGRLGTVKALVATALKIKPVMGSTDEGTIIQLDQARGMKKALVKMVDSIEEKKSSDPQERMVGIAHCNCPQRAEMVKEEILKRLPFKDVILVNTAGVSTMYANDGGIIVVA